jgi:hypothetical protein
LTKVLVLTGVAAVIGGAGVTLGAVRARERAAFLPLEAAVPVVASTVQGTVPSDSARVARLLQAARGINTAMCELAAGVVDGRFGWSSDANPEWRAGGSADSLARDVVAWVHRHEPDATTVSVLRTAIADSDPCVRRLAAPLLGRVKHPSAYDAMVQALGASDAAVREAGALALGFADDPRSIQALSVRLSDDAPRVRATAAWALGEIELPAVVDPLINALGDSDPIVRQAAARALGEVENAKAIPPLTNLLKSDRDAAVRKAAALALGEIIG